MTSFQTSTQINAPAATIWALLTDAASWSTWNTTVDKVDGQIAPGEQVTVHAKINPGRAFPVKVTEFVPAQRMVWTGGMPLGLFKGVRTYGLKETAGGTEFSMREEYSGLLASMMTRSIPDLQPAFDEFAAALKKEAETAA